MTRFIFACAAAALLAGCGGGGGTPSTPGNSAKPSGQKVNVTVEIPAPPAASSVKSRIASRSKTQGSSYIPTGGTKATVLVDNIAVLSNVAVGASYSFSTTVGTHYFTLTYYDASSNALSTGTTSATVTAAGPNNVSIILGGVVKTIAFGTLPSITVGTASSPAVTVIAKDADGNTITGGGQYSVPIVVSVAAPGATTIAPNGVSVQINSGPYSSSGTLNTPSDTLNLYYPATAPAISGCVFLTATGTGLTTIMSSNLVAGSTAPATPLNPTVSSTGFSRVVLSWTALAGATKYNVYRGTAPGLENQFVATSTTTSATDWYAKSGPVYYYRVSGVTGTGEHCDTSAEPSGTATGDPTTLGAILVWLDASDNTTITSATPGDIPIASGDKAFSWADKSGNAFNATATGAAQASYSSTILNSRPAMSGSGTQYWTFSAPPNTQGNFSAFTIGTFNSGLDTLYDSYHRAPSLTVSAAPAFAPDGLGSVAFTGGTTHILSHLGATSGATLTSSLYLDGATSASVTGSVTNSNLATGGYFPIAPSALTLWQFQSPQPPSYNTFIAGQYFQGSMGEFAIYGSTLSSANQRIMEGYLAWKWGEQALLPAGHPYKSAAP